MATIIIIATVSLGFAILAESALSFLAWCAATLSVLGRDAERLGALLYAQGPVDGDLAGVAISLAVFGFNMGRDALRDLLDLRLRGGRLVRR